MALLGLVAVAFFAYLSHFRHGGYYHDDWSDVAATFNPPGGPGIGNTLDYFANLFPYRPGLILYVPGKYWVLGDHPARQLALAVGLGVAVSILLYGILRRFRVPRYHAWLIAALLLVYPSFDSIRLWEAASLPALALAIALAGFLVALIGLDRRSWKLHACAAALYLVSILTYEITLPLIAGAGLLYVLRTDWRTGRGRWAVDLGVVVAGGLWNGLHTNREVSSLSGDVKHLWEIVEASGTVIASTGVVVGETPPTTLVLIVLTAVFAAGAAACIGGWRSRESRWGLREWMLLGAAGLIVAALGWAMFIPADAYYTPSLLGYTNRVNAVAGVGLVMLVYAAIGVGVVLVARLLPFLERWTAAIVLALGVLLGVSYVHVLERHSDVWDQANRYELEALAQVKTAYPQIPSGTTLFTSGYPAYLTLGVPVFAATWDLKGMLIDEYQDSTLKAYPLVEGGALICGPDGISMTGTVESVEAAPYGSARLLDLSTGKHVTLRTRRECERALPDFPPGPLYAMTQY